MGDSWFLGEKPFQRGQRALARSRWQWGACGLLWVLLGVLGEREVKGDQIVFSELMLEPASGQAAWVEVRNLTATPFDIAEWRLEGDEGQFAFAPFSAETPQASFLQPFERIVLTAVEPAELRETHSLDPSLRVFGPWQGRIRGVEGALALRDKNGLVVTEVGAALTDAWPRAARATGHSVVLRDVDRPSSDFRNWRVSVVLGGTPGYEPLPTGGRRVRLPSLSSFTHRTLLDYGSSWRYQASGRELPRAWRDPGYDDSRWDEGRGHLGFESAPIPGPGLQTRLRRGAVAYYFRAEFDYQGPIEGVKLQLDQVVDDGVVYYLNGRRIGRIRMRTATPAQRSFATETITDAVEERGAVVTDGTWLRQGRNVLAVSVHQANAGSSDLVFGCRLGVLTPTKKVLLVTQIAKARQGPGFVELLNESDRPVTLSDYEIGTSERGGALALGTPDPVVQPGKRVRIALDALQPESPPVSRLAVRHRETGELVDQVTVDLPAKGLVQVRSVDAPDQWQIRRLEVVRAGDVVPRPGERRVILSEVSLGETAGESWVELRNLTGQAIDAGQLLVGWGPSVEERVALQGTIPAQGFRVFEWDLVFAAGEHSVFLVNGLGETLEAFDFTVRGSQRHWERDGIARTYWRETPIPSPNESGALPSPSPVVINEIQFDPAFGNESGEFVELHNTSEQSVDISGYRFASGIRYAFPAGSVLPPSGFVVLARDSEWLEASYPELQVAGQFRGSLKNRGERLLLVDGQGRRIDEVHYEVEGDWPERSGGRGSSLELIHPALDNQYSSAWRASREARTSPFRRYRFQGTYQELAKMGSRTDYRELHFYLVGEGHIVLRDVQLLEVESGRKLMNREMLLSDDAYGDDSRWLIQGNHADSFVEGNRLHLIAHGHGDNRANRAEIDVPQLRAGRTYELSFEARWVSGVPRLVAHTWDNSFAHSFRLDVPRNLGTPGRENSTLVATPPVVLENVSHSPAVPRAGESVRVRAELGDLGSGRAEVLWRLAELDSGTAWEIQPMTPESSGEARHEGLSPYAAELPVSGGQGDVIEFFVRVIGEKGATSYLPRFGEARPAYLVFDDRTRPTDLRRLRFVVHPRDLERIEGFGQGESRNKYPRLSNMYFNATFISEEDKVFYGAVLRRSGSPWTRRGGISRGKWKLPKSQEFRSQGKFSFDDDPDKWSRHHNRFVRYLLYLLGHPSSQNEFVRIVINGQSEMVREDVEPVDADFLERNFKDGNQGELYRIDDQWWFSDAWRQAHRDAEWRYLDSDNAGLYRNAWMKRSREEDDDYSKLIDFFEIVTSGRYSTGEIQKWLDADQIMKMTAVMGYVGDWDTFTQRRGKNAYFYRRPTDGRFQFLQWDSDLSFQRGGWQFYGGSRAFVRWVERPENLNRLHAYLSQLRELCHLRPERVHAWMDAESLGPNRTQINRGHYQDWFQQRDRALRNFLE